MFVVAAILGFIAIVVFLAAPLFKYREYGEVVSLTKRVRVIAAGVFTVALLCLIPTVLYTQDPGEARVLKNWSGAVEGADVTEGFSMKLPWVDLVDYDIRNNQAVYIGNGTDDFNGKKPDGPQITFTDKDGVSANADVVVRFSVRPDRVENVYRDYGVQEQFKVRLINNDIRSVVRQAPTKYGTLDAMTKRAELEKQIFDELVSRWEKEGVAVESVALQEIRYPDDVKQRFADAQNARTEIVKAQAQLEATQISAQQKVVQAESEAKANGVLAASLTEPILRQRYLDTLAKLAEAGNLVVVPEGSNNILNVPAK